MNRTATLLLAVLATTPMPSSADYLSDELGLKPIDIAKGCISTARFQADIWEMLREKKSEYYRMGYVDTAIKQYGGTQQAKNVISAWEALATAEYRAASKEGKARAKKDIAADFFDQCMKLMTENR